MSEQLLDDHFARRARAHDERAPGVLSPTLDPPPAKNPDGEARQGREPRSQERIQEQDAERDADGREAELGDQQRARQEPDRTRGRGSRQEALNFQHTRIAPEAAINADPPKRSELERKRQNQEGQGGL